MNRPCSRRWLLPVVMIALVVLPCAFAQETTAGVQGTVKDSSGAVIAGATVEVSGPAMIGIRRVQTDAGGNYQVTTLPSGLYTISVSAKGFRTAKETGIEMRAGRLPRIDLTLQVGTLAEVVEVSSGAPIVDVTQSKVAVTVEHEVLDNIPKGRSFQSLIPFAPGARMEPLQSSAANRTNGFQIDGASDGENVYLVDGVNTTNVRDGGTGKDFQMDFIQEVQIKSSSFEAEHGGALGGVINAVPKRGSSNWHGELTFHWRNNAMNANNDDRILRNNPATSLNTTTRVDATPEYFYGAKDQRNIVEPGFQVGGPLLKDRLAMFSSYVPSVDTERRTTTFTRLNPGPRNLTRTTTQHNMYNRLDYKLFDQLRLYGAWNYAYWRQTGLLGGQDSAAGQVNTGATTDPNTIRADFGTVNPLSLYTVGGDWTPTSKLVVSTRYGYWFENHPQRGTPVGTRYVFQDSISATTRDLANQPFAASSFNTAGFANITSNLGTTFDAYKRHSLNTDASYFAHFHGTHTFKVGLFWQQQSNEVLRNFQGGRVDLYWGRSYQPFTGTAVCDQIKAQNLASFGQSACQGRYGYFIVGTGVTNTGTDTQTAKAFYFQDSWNVGRGLTLNLGVRFDQETQPPYDPNRFPTVEFGWGDKIAPRIGGAYDLFHNNKVKLYASYGQFYDIMKMGLARGSFGSDYWHNCVYATDDLDYTKITPTLPLGGGCPAKGAAPGVNGRFIENVDFRATKADPRDPAVQPDMKPMKQHEFVTGVDWAITPSFGLETRYSRKRLDNTIEDMAITDDLGFYIGNPGSKYADVLHRPVVIPNDAGVDYVPSVPFCAECPKTIPAIRRYDAVEFRLAKRATGAGKWWGSVSYTWSRLTGNYSGLTNTDPTDGAGGRHSPNNHRAFDIPTMTYLPSGKIDDGPLSTDRPHTAKGFGFYRQKWFGMETLFAFNQTISQGSPINTCLPVLGASSACQWAEQRGTFVNFTRAANGDFVKGDVVQNARTSPFFQSDVLVTHSIQTSEKTQLRFDLNVTNLFNQRSDVGYYEFGIPANFISPARPHRFPGDLDIDFGKVMNGYNYVDALNGKGTFAGVQDKLTLANRYGKPNLFQIARSLRLSVRFVF